MTTNNTSGWEEELYKADFFQRMPAHDQASVQFFIEALLASEKEGVDRKYSAIFEWLLGENGEFPDLSKPPHYKFRTELRRRLSVIKGEDKKN